MDQETAREFISYFDKELSFGNWVLYLRYHLCRNIKDFGLLEQR
jgi:hypothetical protein